MRYFLLFTGVVAALAAISFGWYLFSRRYNYRKASRIIEWVECALSGEGRVLGLRWASPSRFKAPLRLTSKMFHRAWIDVEMAPCEQPLRWLARRLHKEPETIVFQADLDTPPSLSLDIQNLRSFARSNRRKTAGGPEWRFFRTQPLIISSQTDWPKEVVATVTSLASSGSRDYLNISFRRNSPHFSVTLPLEAVTAESGGPAWMLDTMRELAARSSAELF